MFSRAYVEITNVCNLACAFCPGTAREKRFMTPEIFALLAGKLRPYTDFLYLHVMGEPLLHPQLAEILHICEELGFRVCLTTNGTLLPEKLPLPSTRSASPSIPSRATAAAMGWRSTWSGSRIAVFHWRAGESSAPCACGIRGARMRKISGYFVFWTA